MQLGKYKVEKKVAKTGKWASTSFDGKVFIKLFGIERQVDAEHNQTLMYFIIIGKYAITIERTK